MFRYNEHDWSPLDIAIMMNHIPMIHLLLQHGAEESERSEFFSIE
jgi:ankyrin repeat protein